MKKLVFNGITVEAAEITEDIKRNLALSVLLRGKVSSETPPKHVEVPEQEITALVDEINQVLDEQMALADLGRQVAAELAWLDTTIAGIDGYTAAQVRDVVKRLCQEQRAVLKALRYVVRQGK